MTDVERIREVVGRTERRLAFLGAQQVAVGASAIALGLFAVGTAAARLGLWNVPLAWLGGTAACTFVATLVVWVVRRKRQEDRAASRIDAVYELDDRVLSALAILRIGQATGMGAALIADAAESVRDVEPSRAAAYDRPKRLGWLAVGLVAAAAALAVPDRWLTPAAADPGLESGDVRAAGRELEARSLEIAKTVDPNAGHVRDLAVEQADLGARMERGDLAPRDALARLSSLDERIDRAARDAGAGGDRALRATRRRMEKALGEAAGAGEPGEKRDSAGEDQSSEGSRGAANDLSKKARDAAAAAREGRLAEGDERALREAARQLATELDGIEGAEALQEALDAIAEGELTAEELERLAAALEAAEARADAQEAAEQLRAANRAAKQGMAGRGRPGEEGNGPFAGHGSTNDREGDPYTPEDKGSTMQNDPNARPDTRGEYEAKYESERLDRQGYTSQARSKLQGAGKATSLFVQTAPGKAAATVPYQDAYPRYLRSAERSIERSDVPPEMRDVVRGYFDSINPR